MKEPVENSFVKVRSPGGLDDLLGSLPALLVYEDFCTIQIQLLYTEPNQTLRADGLWEWQRVNLGLKVAAQASILNNNHSPRLRIPSPRKHFPSEPT